MTSNTWRPWKQAMTEALYGKAGFYRRPAGPAAHFRTSVHVSPAFAAALGRLAGSVVDGAGRDEGFAVVDLGSGRGELLRSLAGLAPPSWRLVGVDVVDRPAGLPARIEWCADLSRLEAVPYGVLVANEWLDNVPVDVVQDGQLVEVDDQGNERPAGPPGGRDAQWLEAWHGSSAPPGRYEIGWPRDDAWAGAVQSLGRGLAVAIDYRLDPARHRSGTLAGYRDGRQVPPVPDGSCDLTAHVLLESCAAAAGPVRLTDQRTALSALGVTARTPPRQLASADPAGYLRALAHASEEAELLDPAGLGGFGWLVQAVDVPLPGVFDLQDRSIG